MGTSAFTITEPVKFTLTPGHGRLLGSNARYEKFMADLDGVYRDADAFQTALAHHGDRAVYWVESSLTQADSGGLITGLSVLEPGRVGEEYFMTRGHLHARSECAEVYLAISGRGVMLLETIDGESRAIELVAGQAAYVPGGWIHRSVNVGPDRFETLFTYSAEAGQDYAIIERAGGMQQLIVATSEGWATRRNPDHRGYVA